MASVAVTGANGFLGWHTRSALRGSGIEQRAIALGDAFDLGAAARAVSDSSRLVHIAGVNRGTDEEVRNGNVRFATQLAEAIR